MKNKLIKLIDKLADEQTIHCINNLSSEEASKINKDIDKKLDMIKGVMPKISIIKAEKYDNNVRWELLFKTTLHSNTVL